jgi:hypothetical protein
MLDNHISDEEIQAYIDNPKQPNAAAIESHIRHCASCRNKLADY